MYSLCVCVWNAESNEESYALCNTNLLQKDARDHVVSVLSEVDGENNDAAVGGWRQIHIL